MLESVDSRSPVPLYAQIATLLKAAIASGELRPMDSLPSVRDLAARLRLNPGTVVQAYQLLEEEGFVRMRQGTGTFVLDVPAERRAKERARQAQALVRRMLVEARRIGLSPEDLQASLDEEIGIHAS